MPGRSLSSGPSFMSYFFTGLVVGMALMYLLMEGGG